MNKKQRKLYKPKMIEDEKTLFREVRRINRATMFDNILVKILACIIIAFAEANIIFVVLRDTLEMGMVESITIILAVALVLVFLPHSIGHMYAERYYEKSGNSPLFYGAITFYLLTLFALIVPRIFFYLERGNQQTSGIVDLSGGTAIGTESELTNIANMSMVAVLFIVMISCGFVLALISFKASDPLKKEIVDLTIDKFYIDQEIKLRQALDTEFKQRLAKDEQYMKDEDELKLKAAITEIHYTTEKMRQDYLFFLAAKRNNPEDVSAIMKPEDMRWIDETLNALAE